MSLMYAEKSKRPSILYIRYSKSPLMLLDILRDETLRRLCK